MAYSVLLSSTVYWNWIEIDSLLQCFLSFVCRKYVKEFFYRFAYDFDTLWFSQVSSVHFCRDSDTEVTIG